LDVAGAENAGGEGDEGVQHDKDDVEIVDLRQRPGRRPVDEQEQRRGEREEARQHVQTRRPAVVGHDNQHARRDERNEQHELDHVDRQRAHRRSPRKRSSAWISTLSKRSRMRKRKMPITMKAISTEKATLISTTSGMPLAPV